MTRKLYIYDHCPFCVKAEMIFGLKNLPFERIILLNDDEAGPISMVGRKVLPILEEEARFMPESMDIVTHIDQQGTPVLTGTPNPAIADWINATNSTLYRLYLPRAACAPLPEFATTAARAYFVQRKEEFTGPFFEILKDSSVEIASLNKMLEMLAPLIRNPEAVNGTLSTDDIHLFAHVHSLSLVRGIQYPPAVEAYRQAMSRRSGVGLYDTIAV
ncbi:glutaredoxin 2 [Acetobacter farinalis]|uniref:Glutaredoxin 2 n=1 Tax=Acetobacter farinalis TaxID=1260984 RepID=A0ABT3Q9Y4_9PROT|nr:glutaredoxin 2 [Acetobacter farinalis]MCX2562093.1 glutaredoxin 2 [Acetobacter farinalis]NHO30735.1 glutaredoxin 2 [Acetobacter farinalis]